MASKITQATFSDGILVKHYLMRHSFHLSCFLFCLINLALLFHLFGLGTSMFISDLRLFWLIMTLIYVRAGLPHPSSISFHFILPSFAFEYVLFSFLFL